MGLTETVEKWTESLKFLLRGRFLTQNRPQADLNLFTSHQLLQTFSAEIQQNLFRMRNEFCLQNLMISHPERRKKNTFVSLIIPKLVTQLEGGSCGEKSSYLRTLSALTPLTLIYEKSHTAT